MAKGVAWYDWGRGWLRDMLILLHVPYLIWFLAYVVIGAALAPQLNWGTLGWTLLAFFLGMGIGAHFLDELNGRPLKTRVPDLVLKIGAGVSIAGAIAIGAVVGARETWTVIPCIIFGGFIVFAYTLEWGPKGFFHRDEWFGVAWGAFPVITAYVAQVHTISSAIVLVALACFLYSLAQRTLSTQVRFFRRKVDHVEGYMYLNSNEGRTALTLRHIIGPPEVALKLMTEVVVVAALGLAIIHI